MIDKHLSLPCDCNIGKMIAYNTSKAGKRYNQWKSHTLLKWKGGPSKKVFFTVKLTVRVDPHPLLRSAFRDFCWCVFDLILWIYVFWNISYKKWLFSHTIIAFHRSIRGLLIAWTQSRRYDLWTSGMFPCIYVQISCNLKERSQYE